MLAGDNLFSDGLAPFAKFALAKRAPMLGVYDVGDLEAIRRYNAIELDDDDRLTFFEKPQQPRSTLTGIALYFYPRESLPLVGETWRPGTIPTSRAGWSSGSTRGCPCMPGVSPAAGTTSAPRRRWPKPMGFTARG